MSETKPLNRVDLSELGVGTIVTITTKHGSHFKITINEVREPADRGVQPNLTIASNSPGFEANPRHKDSFRGFKIIKQGDYWFYEPASNKGTVQTSAVVSIMVTEP